MESESVNKLGPETFIHLTCEKCYPHQAREGYLGSAMRNRSTPTHVQTSLQTSRVHESRSEGIKHRKGVKQRKLLVHMPPKSNTQSPRRTMACSRHIERP